MLILEFHSVNCIEYAKEREKPGKINGFEAFSNDIKKIIEDIRVHIVVRRPW
jgi:hypothetical protein